MSAYGMRLRAGRDVTDSDVMNSLPVMLVNDAFVRRFFSGEDPLGRTVTVIANPGAGAISLGPKTIIGIVVDSVHDSMRDQARPAIYQPLAQRTFPLYYPAFFLAVRPMRGSLTARPARRLQPSALSILSYASRFSQWRTAWTRCSPEIDS